MKQEVPVNISEGQNTIADVILNIAYKTSDHVVVSASKHPEKITDAPASIQVIGKKELEQFTGSNT
ncbi:MAG TPA: hypothetical protein VNA26_04150, partial [Chitinophagaceae bacterium]|nr:hypothetical protein [Chitinophagaceae bacterium]